MLLERWAGCSDNAIPSLATLRSSTVLDTWNCTACPGFFYTNCSNAFGPEWTNDSSISEGSGCKMRCKRINYLNNSLACCYGQESSLPYQTCNPKLVPGSAECKPVLIDYCSADANRIKSSYCTRDAGTYQAALEKFCTVDNIKNYDLCRNWVMNVNQRGNIDVLMQAFCSKYPKDTLCCNMLSKIPCPNKFDMRCTSVAAYETSSMISTKCPDVINCNQQVSLDSESRNFLVGSKINLSCGQKTDVPLPAANKPAAPNKPANNSSAPNKPANNSSAPNKSANKPQTQSEIALIMLKATASKIPPVVIVAGGAGLLLITMLIVMRLMR